MHTYLIRVELLHEEREADYAELATILYAFKMYAVIYNRFEKQWFELPQGQFLYSDATIDIRKCQSIIEKIVEKLIRDNEKYNELDIPTYYTLMISEVAKTADGKPLLLGALHKTVDSRKFPPGNDA